MTSVLTPANVSGSNKVIDCKPTKNMRCPDQFTQIRGGSKAGQCAELVFHWSLNYP